MSSYACPGVSANRTVVPPAVNVGATTGISGVGAVSGTEAAAVVGIVEAVILDRLQREYGDRILTTFHSRECFYCSQVLSCL